MDNFCKKNKLKNIHILKIDTQGNEAKVLKGSSKSIRMGIFNIIELEIPTKKGPDGETIPDTDKEPVIVTTLIDEETGEVVILQTPTKSSKKVDCVLNEWSEWGTCSVECGGGTHTRRRTIISPASGGVCTDNLLETKPCNTDQCTITVDNFNCILSDWSDWSQCSSECNGGEQTRIRDVINPAVGNGTCSPYLHEVRSCNIGGCPIEPDYSREPVIINEFIF